MTHSRLEQPAPQRTLSCNALAILQRRVTVCGVRMDNLSLNEAAKLLTDHAISGGPPAYVVTPNAQHVVLLNRDKELQEAYSRAGLVLADGMPVVWASRWLGCSLKERVAGIDLLEAICAHGAERGLRLFLLGGREGAAERAATILESRYPGLQVVGTARPPFGLEREPAVVEETLRQLRRCCPDVLLVGLGAPRQELWLRDHAAASGVPVSIGIGASFDVIAGLIPRAPLWMRPAGLEWLYRLTKEPRRLWKRYLVGNLAFIWLVFRAKLSQLSSYR